MRELYAADFARAKSAVSGHVLKERPSRAFDFRTPCKGSAYAYSLTWTPGSVMLAGDLGDMMVNHWQAMREFKPAMAWLVDSDWDYLLRKTSAAREQVADAEGTAADILLWAREQVEDRRGARGAYGDDGPILRKLKDRYATGRAWGAPLWRMLERELAAEIYGASEEYVYQLFVDLSLHDCSGRWRPHPRALAQITAVQHGARLILAECFPYEWLRG